ncbi:hypothetical protein L1887_20777 [Cichorium endivia]|nr:hypothetical protein L1887_20777 [Cichorium endivia]
MNYHMLVIHYTVYIHSFPYSHKKSRCHICKKATKKEASKAEKLKHRHEVAAAAFGVTGVSIDDPNPLASHYGDILIKDLQSKKIFGRVWTPISSLTEQLKDRTILIHGRAQAIRAVGKKMAFFTIREKEYTVQCVSIATDDLVGKCNLCRRRKFECISSAGGSQTVANSNLLPLPGSGPGSRITGPRCAVTAWMKEIGVNEFRNTIKNILEFQLNDNQSVPEAVACH